MPLLGDTFYDGPDAIVNNGPDAIVNNGPDPTVNNGPDAIPCDGSDTIALPRQMLHARTLAFNHPVTGKNLSFTAPLPTDFLYVLSRLFSAAQRETLAV